MLSSAPPYPCTIHSTSGLDWNGFNGLDCAWDGFGLGEIVFTFVMGWIDLGLRVQWTGLVWFYVVSSPWVHIDYSLLTLANTT